MESAETIVGELNVNTELNGQEPLDFTVLAEGSAVSDTVPVNFIENDKLKLSTEVFRIIIKSPKTANSADNTNNTKSLSLNLPEVNNIINIIRNHTENTTADNSNIKIHCARKNINTLTFVENNPELDQTDHSIKCVQTQNKEKLCKKKNANVKLKTKYMVHMPIRVKRFNNLQCSKCKVSFKSKQERDIHQEKCHIVSCLLCPSIFNGNDDLRNHLLLHHDANCKCTECDIICTNGIEYVQHVKQAHSIGDAIAISETLKNKAPVERKAKVSVIFIRQQTNNSKENSLNEKNSSNQSFVCDICKKSYKYKTILKRHLLTHKNSKFNCDICGKKVRSHAGLISHMSLHNSSGARFTCAVCQKDCHTKSYLQLHVRKKHPGGLPATYKCDECGKSYKWEQSLKGHLAVAHDKKYGTIHSCEICNKRFSNKHILKIHLLKHEDNRPYQCEQCGMEFKYQHTWTKHVDVVHSEKKEFQCSECGKLFKTKAYMDMHISSVHMAGAPVTCKDCNQQFKTLKILKTHIQVVHTKKKERRYICPYCSRNFLSPKDLRRHQKTHTGEKDHICPYCTKAFSRSDNLKTHLKIHIKEV